jgi:hypothetical protein
MRILHRNIKVANIIFHTYAAILYFACFLYFAYSNFKLFPMWVGVQDRLLNSKQIYERKLAKKENIENKEEGKKRYEKEFLNKLDEGEKLIVLYSGKIEEEKEIEENRKLSLFGNWKLQIKLWWANL